jgi:hypothetical protein
MEKGGGGVLQEACAAMRLSSATSAEGTNSHAAFSLPAVSEESSMAFSEDLFLPRDDSPPEEKKVKGYHKAMSRGLLLCHYRQLHPPKLQVLHQDSMPY